MPRLLLVARRVKTRRIDDLNTSTVSKDRTCLKATAAYPSGFTLEVSLCQLTLAKPVGLSPLCLSDACRENELYFRLES